MICGEFAERVKRNACIRPLAPTTGEQRELAYRQWIYCKRRFGKSPDELTKRERVLAGMYR